MAFLVNEFYWSVWWIGRFSNLSLCILVVDHLKVCLFSPKMYEFHFFFLLSILKVKSKTTPKTKVREKKVYTLPGEKHDPPEEVVLIQSQISAFFLKHVSNNWSYQCFFWQREPLRIFYEYLWKQMPTSEMTEFWWDFISSNNTSCVLLIPLFGSSYDIIKQSLFKICEQ